MIRGAAISILSFLAVTMLVAVSLGFLGFFVGVSIKDASIKFRLSRPTTPAPEELAAFERAGSSAIPRRLNVDLKIISNRVSAHGNDAVQTARAGVQDPGLQAVS